MMTDTKMDGARQDETPAVQKQPGQEPGSDGITTTTTTTAAAEATEVPSAAQADTDTSATDPTTTGDQTPTAILSSSTAPAPTEPAKPKPTIPRKPVPSTYLEVDKSRPQDFEGEVATDNELPSPEVLKKIEDYIVLDRDGKSHTFKSLYTGNNVSRRVLMIFIRHFFCGNCQDYIRSMAESISPDALLGLPVSTFIVVIGCGDPALIEGYAKDTNCQFPIYTDPTRSIFDALGMKQTLAMGAKPAYMKRPFSTSIISSIGQGLRALPSGLALKGGNQRQVGGEFLFEPSDLVTPVSSPKDEKRMAFGSPEDVQNGKTTRDCAEEEGRVEEKQVTWCHRMKTTRDHCEIPELMEILGLDGQGEPIKDEERWRAALLNRKGKGSSMARQMSELSRERGS